MTASNSQKMNSQKYIVQKCWILLATKVIWDDIHYTFPSYCNNGNEWLYYHFNLHKYFPLCIMKADNNSMIVVVHRKENDLSLNKA